VRVVEDDCGARRQSNDCREESRGECIFAFPIIVAETGRAPGPCIRLSIAAAKLA